MDGATFIKQYIPLREDIKRLCYTLMPGSDEAEDIAQEVLIKIWELRDTLDNVESPKAYALTLARNRCIDKLRSPAVRLRSSDVTPDQVEAWATNTRTPQDALREKEAQYRLKKWLRALPEQQQRIFKLRHFDMLDNQAVADKLGLQEVTVRSVLSRLRKEARKVILDEITD